MDILLGVVVTIAIVAVAAVVFGLLLKFQMMHGLSYGNRRRHKRGGFAEIDEAIHHWDRISTFRGPGHGPFNT